jgi:hypothetical protein
MHIVIRPYGDFDIDVCINHDVEVGVDESNDTGHASIEMISDIAVSSKKMCTWADIKYSNIVHVYYLRVRCKKSPIIAIDRQEHLEN